MKNIDKKKIFRIDIEQGRKGNEDGLEKVLINGVVNGATNDV